MSYKALLFCSEESTARVIVQVLSELDFQGEPCNEPFEAVKKLTSERLDAMVIDCSNEQDAALLVKSARNSSFNQQALFVAVVDGKSGVSHAFRLGANLVLAKPVSLEQAKGTLRMARGLLHKNEVAKPVMPATQPASSPEPKTESIAAPVAPKPPVVPLAPWSPPTAVSIPSASMLEVETEPAPSLEPADAAVLESIPDPTSSDKPAKSVWPVIEAKQESSWQKAAKPMASSLLEAEEAVSKAETKAREAGPSSLPASPIAGVLPAKPPATRFMGAGIGAGQGAAAAPARAPEAETSGSSEKAVKISGQNAVPATIANLAEQKVESGNKKWAAIAAVVLAVAAAGYVGRTKLHPITSGATALMPVTSAPSIPVAPPAIPPPATEPTPAESADTNLPQPPTSQTKAQPATGMSTPRQTVPATKNIANSPTSVPLAPASAPQEVLVVSNQPAAPTSLPKPSADQPVPSAPPVMEVTSNSGDQPISSIVTNSTARVPAPALETSRVSQGVAQGLLIKRVQPIYPPPALSMHLQGAVELLASIGKDGSVTNLKQLSGDPTLGRAALDAVKQWKYRPYLLDGQPIEIQTQITVTFKVP